MLPQMALSHSFLWVIFHCVYMLISIHLSVDGRLGCFHVLAIVNSAAINRGAWDLCCLAWDFSLQRAGSLVGACGLSICGVWP